MNRNRYRVLAALSVLTVTAGAIFGCGAAKDEPLNANITAVEDAAEAEDAEAAEEIPATPVLKETDFLGFILGGNDTQYLHMTLDELNEVTGGAGNWQQYAKGSFVNYGNYLVYTVAPGDVLSGIAIRFGVTYQQIAQWNNIKNPDVISIGQKLTIYPTIIR